MAEARTAPDGEVSATVLIAPELRSLYRAMRTGLSPETDADPTPAESVIDRVEDIVDAEEAAGSALSHEEDRPEPRAATDPASGDEDAPAAAGAFPDVSPAMPASVLERKRWRRDGQRPLIFDGVGLVSSTRSETGDGVGLEFELCLASDGRAMVRMAVAEGTDGRTRSVCVAEPIASAADLDAMLEKFDPSRAFPLASLGPEDLASGALAGVIETSRALKDDMRHLAASVCVLRSLNSVSRKAEP